MELITTMINDFIFFITSARSMLSPFGACSDLSEGVGGGF